VAVDLVERRLEPLLSRARHPPQGLLQILDGRHHVVVLGTKEVQALLQLAVLLVGHQVHGPMASIFEVSSS